jgi:hypothetical protein
MPGRSSGPDDLVRGGARKDIVELLAETPGLPADERVEPDPDLTCGIHAGLIRGAMEAFGEPGTKVAVEPFSDPSLSRVTLTRPPAGAPRRRSR